MTTVEGVPLTEGWISAQVLGLWGTHTHTHTHPPAMGSLQDTTANALLG